VNRPESATQPDSTVGGKTPPAESVLDTLHLVRAEYLEMPGLGLTIPQVARAFTVTLQESERTLTRLVEEGLLTRDSNGAYRRR
jgi:DNA-binding IclR family transcriptional regulator